MNGYVVSVWRIDFDPGDGTMIYDERLFGPYRDEERVGAAARRYRRAIERADMSATWGVSVRSLEPGTYPARDLIAELHEDARD